MLSIVTISGPLQISMYMSSNYLWKQRRSTIIGKQETGTQTTWDMKQDTRQYIARDIDFDTDLDTAPKHCRRVWARMGSPPPTCFIKVKDLQLDATGREMQETQECQGKLPI